MGQMGVSDVLIAERGSCRVPFSVHHAGSILFLILT